MSGYRLDRGGTLIDRQRPLSFRFDGRDLRGYAGDTLAAALMAAGVRTIARSFKYHRRRGIVSAGPEEPNALITLRTGAHAEPNTRATVVDLFDGLEAVSQNRWPSLEHDLMAVNDLFGSLFSAGFYYKTFMGPTRAAWMVYERLIRRAAGLGRAPDAADPDRYEKSHLFCDVLVVGSGAAGLAAATAAARTGARVVVCEEGAEIGVSLSGEAGRLEGLPAAEWTRASARALAAFPNVTLKPRTTVYGYYDGNVLGAVERVADHLRAPPSHMPRQRHWTIRAGEVVLATGAIERPILFDGNDLPGVMLAGATQRYALAYGVAPGRRLILFGAHDGIHDAALALHGAGVTVAGVVDVRDEPGGSATACEAAGIAVHAGSVVARGYGRKSLERVEIARLNRDGSLGATQTVAADICATSGAWQPTLHLHSQAGSRPSLDAERGIFLPGDARERWRAAGACAGRFGVAACMEDGEAIGRDAARDAGFAAVEPASAPDRMPAVSGALPMVIWQAPSPRGHKAKIFVDLQHDVTAADVELAYREGFRSVEHLKRYTTLGMATDQGKTSNVPGLALMAHHRGTTIDVVGTTTFRAPYTPVALGTLAGREVRSHLRPVRRTPMHDWHVANGADMIAVGPWMRPRRYGRAGESIEDSYIREMKMVRYGVGIVDVSTLGKIDVQGPDAAEFLDRVYANTFSTLAVGKARYGVMLRDDGFVLDDGTSWRLTDTRYLMTTTTANAGAVMQRLEFLLDAVWPDLKVNVTSVTEQWAGIAVSGPLSRNVLEKAVDDADLSNEALPHMGLARGYVDDVPVMLARLSFSGELAYEVYAPSHSGLAVWAAILAVGQSDGIVAYGTEALGALRVEKGHVAGSELDGRTTMEDLGLARMASRKKDFLGKAMMGRAALNGPERMQLVGLMSLDGRAIPIGAQLLPETGGGDSLGHVTANTWSPTLECYVALALLAGGRARHGERLRAAAPVRGLEVSVAVRDPHFYDPGNERLHA